ncbi:MAG TPA: PIN domain-containing protein [Terrimesophilobacter sp.]|mgnify:CR=1 FL=1|nr:PIN domain-containing protein [Terrimesophilobacter sp.]HRQ00780.1 PIN domain-containing protein [Terrimesophilobacter sp.]
MILVDTSVWIDHFHHTDNELVRLLDNAMVLQHPLVVGELALGALRDRDRIIDLLRNLPAAPVASHDEVLHFVDTYRLYGRGLSLVDAHLLASVLLAPGATLFTRYRRLDAMAHELGLPRTVS